MTLPTIQDHTMTLPTIQDHIMTPPTIQDHIITVPSIPDRIRSPSTPYEYKSEPKPTKRTKIVARKSMRASPVTEFVVNKSQPKHMVRMRPTTSKSMWYITHSLICHSFLDKGVFWDFSCVFLSIVKELNVKVLYKRISLIVNNMV